MRVLYLTLSLVLLDQLTKVLAKGFNLQFLNLSFKGISASPPIELIGNYFKLTYVENPGMAFGWLPFEGKSTLILSIFTLVASIGLIIYLFKIRKESILIRLPLAIIISGAIGNLIDRIFYDVIFNGGRFFQGSVVDFIDLDFIDLHWLGLTRWPVFNFADVYVSFGVAFLFISSIIVERKRKKEELALQKMIEEEQLKSQIELGNSEIISSEENTDQNENDLFSDKDQLQKETLNEIPEVDALSSEADSTKIKEQEFFNSDEKSIEQDGNNIGEASKV